MKNFMFAAIAALAITSCSQNEELDSLANRSEINFTSAAITRANHATTDNFTKFIAYAYSHTENFAGTGSTVINGTKFTKLGAQNIWTAEDNLKFYWPLEKKLSFIAYSSAAIEPTTGVDYTGGTTGYPTLAYTIADSQEDLLVAQAVNKTKEKDETGVNLNFKHALAQIGFSLKGENSTVAYNVTKITIKGAKDSGTFTYSSTPETSIGSWETTSTTKDYSIILSDMNFSGDGTASIVSESLILMPQSLTNVTIDVSYEATKDGDVICKGTTGIKFPTSGNGSSWTIGMKTTYVLTLTPGAEIKLTGDLANWGTETGDLK